MRDGYGANAGEMHFIFSLFEVHQSILHFCGDISVIFVLWQCSWWFSGVPSSKSRFLTIWLGTRNSSACNAGESALILQRGGSLLSFLELREVPGVYSRLATGIDIWKSGLFSEVWTPVQLRWISQESKLRWQNNTDTSRGEAGGQASLVSWNSYIGIPIYFHEESSIITFWSSQLSTPLEVSNGCEAPCPEDLETLGFL